MKLRDELSDGKMCRRTGLAGNTVKKWLTMQGDINPKYQRRQADGKLTAFVPVARASDGHGRAKGQVGAAQWQSFVRADPGEGIPERIQRRYRRHTLLAGAKGRGPNQRDCNHSYVSHIAFMKCCFSCKNRNVSNYI